MKQSKLLAQAVLYTGVILVLITGLLVLKFIFLFIAVPVIIGIVIFYILQIREMK